MKRIIYISIYSFSLFAVLIGFFNIMYYNTVFAESTWICCNQGDCEGIDATPPNCGTTTHVEIIEDCGTTLTISCKFCVDLTYSGCVCPAGGSHFCYDTQTNSIYYGRQVSCYTK